jgi:hypothetical protein
LKKLLEFLAYFCAFVGSGRLESTGAATMTYVGIFALPRQKNHAILPAHARAVGAEDQKPAVNAELGSALADLGVGAGRRRASNSGDASRAFARFLSGRAANLKNRSGSPALSTARVGTRKRKPE